MATLSVPFPARHLPATAPWPPPPAAARTSRSVLPIANGKRGGFPIAKIQGHGRMAAAVVIRASPRSADADDYFPSPLRSTPRHRRTRHCLHDLPYHRGRWTCGRRTCHNLHDAGSLAANATTMPRSQMTNTIVMYMPYADNLFSL